MLYRYLTAFPKDTLPRNAVWPLKKGKFHRLPRVGFLVHRCPGGPKPHEVGLQNITGSYQIRCKHPWTFRLHWRNRMCSKIHVVWSFFWVAGITSFLFVNHHSSGILFLLFFPTIPLYHYSVPLSGQIDGRKRISKLLSASGTLTAKIVKIFISSPSANRGWANVSNTGKSQNQGFWGKLFEFWLFVKTTLSRFSAAKFWLFFLIQSLLIAPASPSIIHPKFREIVMMLQNMSSYLSNLVFFSILSELLKRCLLLTTMLKPLLTSPFG